MIMTVKMLVFWDGVYAEVLSPPTTHSRVGLTRPYRARRERRPSTLEVMS